MAGLPAGEQFILERVARIEALPPSKRPYDAARFLEACRLQEEVAAALPPLPPLLTAFVPSEPEPDVASLALLKLFKAYHISSLGLPDVHGCDDKVAWQTFNFWGGTITGGISRLPAPRMLQLLDQWEDDTLLTMLRVLGAASVLRKQQDVDVNVPVSRLLGKAAERLANPRVAAGYEQQLARLQRSSQLQHAAQPLLSVKELAYVALALQYELLQYNGGEGVQETRMGIATRMLAQAPHEATVYLRLTHNSDDFKANAAWAQRGLEAAIARGSDGETASLAVTAALLTACSFHTSTRPPGRRAIEQQPSSAAAAAEMQRLLKLARTSLRRIHSLLPTVFIYTMKQQMTKAEAVHATLTGQKSAEPLAEVFLDAKLQQR